MESLYTFFQNHEVLFLALAYIVLSFVNSLPEPGQKFEWYAWFYHSVKQCLNQVPAKYQPKEAQKTQ